MSDQLEDFIRNNRAELDLDEPSAHIWQNIERQIPSSKKKRLWMPLGIAASVCVLVCAAYFMGMQNTSSAQLNEELFANEMQYNEFKEASQYYMTTIDHKVEQAKAAGMEDDVLNDLKQLDEVYNELKKELLTTEYQDKEYLINLMINNYKTKINILERIINKNNSDESKFTNDETINI